MQPWFELLDAPQEGARQLAAREIPGSQCEPHLIQTQPGQFCHALACLVWIKDLRHSKLSILYLGSITKQRLERQTRAGLVRA